VENSSLLPWLALAAAIYSNYFEEKRKKIFALSSFLYTLPLPAAFLATYIVRSGILASKHSFSLGNWSISLIAFAALLLLLAATAFRFSCKRGQLASPFSREGLVLFQIFLLFAMGFVITAGTLWPWLTATFGKHALALDASFYINACLPILLLLMANMILIPCLSWDGRSFSTKTLIILLAAAAATIGALYLKRLHQAFAPASRGAVLRHFSVGLWFTTSKQAYPLRVCNSDIRRKHEQRI
jgi:Cytochrome c biogenesis factor